MVTLFFLFGGLAASGELPPVFCDFESPEDLKRFSVRGAKAELVEAHAITGINT